MFDSNPHRVAVNPCIIKSNKLKSTFSYLLAVCLSVCLPCWQSVGHLLKRMQFSILISLSQFPYKRKFFLGFLKEQYLEGCCFCSEEEKVCMDHVRIAHSKNKCVEIITYYSKNATRVGVTCTCYSDSVYINETTL